jgi:hypothetical protein
LGQSPNKQHEDGRNDHNVPFLFCFYVTQSASTIGNAGQDFNPILRIRSPQRNGPSEIPQEWPEMGDIMGDQPFLKRARIPLDAFILHGWYLERGQKPTNTRVFIEYSAVFPCNCHSANGELNNKYPVVAGINPERAIKLVAAPGISWSSRP